MCLLNDIYQLIQEKEGITNKSIEVNRNIIEIAKQANPKELIEDEEYLPMLLFNAAYLGEIEGFTTGFKYGVQLIIKCFE